jgi:hypothetical protein
MVCGGFDAKYVLSVDLMVVRRGRSCGGSASSVWDACESGTRSVVDDDDGSRVSGRREEYRGGSDGGAFSLLLLCKESEV